MIELPTADIGRVLTRVDQAWQPRRAAHHVVLGQSGAGKTTLVKRLLMLRPFDRVLIVDPKPVPDPSWDDAPGLPDTWGRPVPRIGAGFGAEQDGGGPFGYWYRLVATPDRRTSGQAIEEALDIVRTEGHALVVIDDARETCRAYKLGQAVESLMTLGRSAAVSVILATQELGFVPGRNQAAFTWSGHTSGLQPAKDAAALLGKSGRQWTETMEAIPPYQWAYLDSAPGNPGPVLTAIPA